MSLGVLEVDIFSVMTIDPVKMLDPMNSLATILLAMLVVGAHKLIGSTRAINPSCHQAWVLEGLDQERARPKEGI